MATSSPVPLSAIATRSEVVVRPVTSRRERRQFLDLPWALYKDDSNWIPPLRFNQAELLGYRNHPFYDNAEIQTFLAWQGNQPVGRIAAIVNHEHNRRHQERCGFFGFFESVRSEAVSSALFSTACEWLAQRDIYKVRGPANPSMNYECGLLVDGFDTAPTFMMSYNPPWYPELIEAYGFRKARDLLAYFGEDEQLPGVEARLGPLTDQAQQRCNATVRPISRRHFMRDVKSFVDLYNRSLEVNWGFVPLPHREMEKLANSLRYLIIPELAVFAEVDGKCVGAIVGLPDYNPRIKQIDGRLFPFGFIRLLSKRHDIQRCRILSINVVPEYQRWGLGLVLMRALTPKALEIGIREAEFSWVDEGNDMARMGLEKAGARVYKTYRMYELEVERRGDA